MFSNLIRSLGICGLVVTVMALTAQNSSAIGGESGNDSRVRLTAGFSGVKAVAKYEERGTTRRKFNFQLELGTPGQVGTVTAVAANGSVVTMGNFTVNALRRGIIDIDTSEGDVVADLNSGSVVTLKIGGATYTATLR